MELPGTWLPGVGGDWKKKIDCKSASGAVSLQIFFPTLHIQLFFFFPHYSFSIPAEGKRFTL